MVALLAVSIVAVLDVVVGEHAGMVELLLVGPVIATLGASPGQTAIVAAFAFAVGVPLGIAGDSIGSTEHLTGMAALALVGGLSVAIARLRVDRERDAARLSVQYGAARVLAEAESLEEAGPGLLEAIAIPLEWEVGTLWEARGSSALRAVAGWSTPGADGAEFEEATGRLVVGPGFGLPGRVWRSGEPVWVPDVTRDDGFARVDAAARLGLKGALAFPVKAGAECVGVIELFARDVRRPDAEMIELTRALGALIGEFVEAQRAAEAVRASEARKSAVLASTLVGVISIDHEGTVLEFNPAAEEMFGRRAEDAVGAELAELVIPPALRERHRSALRRVVETGEPRLLGRRLELTGMRADGSEFPVELAINRIRGAEPPMFTGTLRDVTQRRRAERERDELLRLEQLARLDATEARDQLQAILSGVADAVTAQAPDGRLLFANDAAVQLLGFESSEELLGADPRRVLERFEILDERGEPLSLERLPGRRALAGEGGGEAVVRFRLRDTGEERWSAVKATPIPDGDGRVAMAINVIENITTHKRAEQAQRFLADSSAVLAGSLDAEQVLGEVAQLAVPEMADWLFVDITREDGVVERVAAAHDDPREAERARQLRPRAPLERGGGDAVARVVRSGRSELFPDLSGSDSNVPLARELAMRSAVVAPLSARGRVLGAVTMAAGPRGRRLDRLDLELAEELARRCATAIDNARLFAERAYIARTLQESLLPAELPDIPGFEAAARFRPAGAGIEVGGDFYDLFPSAGHGWTVVMGDVCGKGPDAAAVTALARYTLRAAAMHERLPSGSLRLLNEALLRQRSDRRFCTVAYANVEPGPDGPRLGFASGGHPLPLLLHAGGDVEFVGEPGTLLGVLPEPRFEDHSLTLAPGDALVFYTDGVIEGRGANRVLDEAALAELVGTCVGAPADAIAAHVEDAAVEAQGGSPRDDIAVLVLRVAA